VFRIKRGAQTFGSFSYAYDYVPIEVESTGMERKEGEKNDMIIKEKSVWMEEGVMQYHGKCEGWQCAQEENGRIWKELEEKVNNSTMKIKKNIIIMEACNK